LLRAIISQPDDDAVRLVYADWLEENGLADQAEFIRVQCELARLPSGDARKVELEVRSEVLLQQHRGAWLDGLAKWIERSYVTFRRGFPWSAYTSRKAYLRNASALATRTVIQEATLDPAREEGPGIAGLPLTGRLRSLRTYSSSFADLHEVLAACTGLTALALFNTCDSGDVHGRLGELLALPSVRGVAQFTLRLRDWGEVARRAVEAVATAELPNVQTLGLDMRGLGHETLELLFRARFVRGLKRLSLSQTFDARALEMLGSTAGLAGLKSLSLHLNNGGGSVFANLADSPALRGLTELRIAGPESECAAALDSALPSRLQILEVWSWNSTDAKREQVVQRLADSRRLVGLVRLRVNDDRLTDGEVAGLAACPHLPALAHLDLSTRKTTATGLEALAQSPHLPALRAVAAPAHLVGHSRRDADALRTLNARCKGRFVVLAPSSTGASCAPGDLRLGIY
jgi:uncharacterized protein (TIGR02996 family)